MNAASLVRLVALAAIWGLSFMLMRVVAPVLPAAVLVAVRTGLAALFLAGVGIALGKQLGVLAHWRHFLIVGLINSALPFLLFSVAAKTLSASMMSILNAIAPIWATLIGTALSRQVPTPTVLFGLVLGVAGVAILVGVDQAALPAGSGEAVAAALGATLCYSVASTYTKRARAVDAFSNAHGSMWAAMLFTAPLVLASPPPHMPGGATLLALGTLGVLCSGVAYMLYFRLINDLGPASALTVTFLIPLFGVLFGHLFLGEHIGWQTWAGGVVVVLAVKLVTGFRLDSMGRKAA